MTNGTDQTKKNEAGASGLEVNVTRQVKLPPFWQANPTLWFAQVDAQFFTFNIKSDNAKYFTVVAALDSSVLQQISDIIEAPPETDKYDSLKKNLIARFTDSQERQLRKLLNEIELGDKKPSQLLREMKALAGTKIDKSVLRTLWLQRIPSRVQIVLSASKDEDLTELSNMADKIMEISSPDHIASVSQNPAAPKDDSTTTALANIIESLQKQMITLTDKVDKLSRNQHQRRYSSRSRSRPRHQSEDGNSECYFHRRFGDSAKNCRPPCNRNTSATSGSNSNNQQSGNADSRR